MTQVSPDGQWWWDGYGWQPISTKPPQPAPQVSMADSVVAGDVNLVTHHSTNVQVNDTQAIAAALQTVMQCPTCGSNNTTLYDCESIDCNNRFCNVCMQSYMHGNIGINGLFCQTHHQAEASFVGKDEEFSKWEKTTEVLLKSFSSRETSKKLLIGFGAVFAFIGFAVVVSKPSEGGPILGLGIILLLIGFAYPSIIESVLKSHTEKMPDVGANSRPKVPNRNLPVYQHESVKEFVIGGMVIK